MYENRAKKIAEEQAAKQQEAERAFNESLSQQQQQQQQSPWGDLGKMSPIVSRPTTPAQGQLESGLNLEQFFFKIPFCVSVLVCMVKYPIFSFVSCITVGCDSMN